MPRPIKVPRACQVCEANIRRYELISGVPLSRKDVRGGVQRFIQLFGHYECVVAELGADRALNAMRMGLLPHIPHGVLVDKKLKKWVEFEQAGKSQELKVYEFIG